MDWAYSVREACLQHFQDADCELFHMILEGVLPEEVYYEQQAMMQQLKEAAYNLVPKKKRESGEVCHAAAMQ